VFSTKICDIRTLLPTNIVGGCYGHECVLYRSTMDTTVVYPTVVCYGHDRRAAYYGHDRPSCILNRSTIDTTTTAARWWHTPTKLLPLTSP